LQAKQKISGEAFCGTCIGDLHDGSQTILGLKAAKEKKAGQAD